MFRKNIFLFFISVCFVLQLVYINCEPKPKSKPRTQSKNKVLTESELCQSDERRQFTNFKVDFAFKVGEYIGIGGQFWRESESENEAIKATIRVLHIGEKRDPSLNKPYSFFEAKVWKEIQDIDDQKKIRYAFSADNMKNNIFHFPRMSEILYVVQDTNLTTAYQFNYAALKSGSDNESASQDSDKMKVYDTTDGTDQTYYLNLKFLLIHFPHPGLKILSIMIFDIKKTNDENPIHYGVVYTEEIYEGTPYYMRHYMKSKRHDYQDFRFNQKYTFSRLDWFFDESKQFCDELPKAPTAVTLLRKKEIVEWAYPALANKTTTEIHFAEFYGLKHQLLRFTFKEDSDHYSLENESNQIDNAEAVINCKTHSIRLTKAEPILCGEDYLQTGVDYLSGFLPKILESKSWSQNKSIPTFYYIAIPLVTIAILVVIGLAIYFVLKPKE